MISLLKLPLSPTSGAHRSSLSTNGLRRNNGSFGDLAVGHASNWNGGVFRSIAIAYLVEIYKEACLGTENAEDGRHTKDFTVHHHFPCIDW